MAQRVILSVVHCCCVEVAISDEHAPTESWQKRGVCCGTSADEAELTRQNDQRSVTSRQAQERFHDPRPQGRLAKGRDAGKRPHGLDEAVPCLGGLFATFYNRGLRASLPLVYDWLSLVGSYLWLIGGYRDKGLLPHMHVQSMCRCIGVALAAN